MVMAIKFIDSCTPHIKYQSHPLKNQWDDDRLQGIIRVSQGQCMHLVSGVSCQELWQVVNDHIIHMTLHWAKKVMVKVWDVYGLIDDLEPPPGLWVIVGYNTTHGLVSLSSKGLIIAHNGDRSIIVQNDQGTMPQYTCIGMRI
jgi:hypothetical protein